jgi:RNA polymerase sigma-70 factor (ECF subfamily)
MDFEQIYHLYFDDVYRYVRRLSGDEHIAEEVTSETFFKAMQKIIDFRGDCDLRVWLCQIAKNCYYSYLHKLKKVNFVDATDLDDAIDPQISIEERFIIHEQAAQIQKLLHTISEPYREVFMWRVFADLSFKQIGQIFGKTNNWACVTYHRAKQQILKKMEDKNNE